MRNLQLIRWGLVAFVMAALIPMTASAQTLERITSSGTLNVGFVPDEAPFSSAADTGYSIELCQRVAEKLRGMGGLSGLKVQHTSTSLEAGLRMVEQGQIDILCGAATDTLERRKRVSFSMPIYNGGIGVVLREDAPSDLTRVLKGEVAHEGPVWRSTINRGLAQHTYAVHDGTVTEDWVRKQIATLGVVATVVTVSEHADGVDMVAQGKADAYFGDRAILRKITAGHADSDDLMLLDRYFTYEPLALVMARNNDDFRLVVDTALSELYTSDEFAALYGRHFGKPGELTLRMFKIYARR